jgi:diguanylate cyclase (GGDEF)-like protein
MTQSAEGDPPVEAPAQRGRWRAAWRWLTRPLFSGPTFSHRQTHLLAWLLVFMFGLATAALILVLVVDPAFSPRRNEYVRLIMGLDALVALAYGLNCAGRYALAAGLTVIVALLGPWGSLAVDPTILHGDFVPLAYVTISLSLASVLLSPLATGLLAGLQLVSLALIPLVSPATASVNWPSFMALILFMSVLNIVFSVISQQYLAQIDRQTRRLAESEAALRELSVRDHLTQLFNRRYLEESLAREIRRSARSHYPIGVILLDIDHFKRVNDTWGHAAGDAVLQRLGQLALAHIRGGDIACRYGGEEFVLILPESSPAVVRERAEHLREEVKRLQIDYGGQRLEAITVSLGVAVFPDHGATGEAILKSADNAMYRAKAEGRDRVVVATV